MLLVLRNSNRDVHVWQSAGSEDRKTEVPRVNVMGALFVAGSAFEASLLLASIAAGWKWGPYRPGVGAFIGLVVVGAAAAAATGGLGSALMRTHLLRVAPANAQEMSGPPVVEARAGIALILGIASVLLNCTS